MVNSMKLFSTKTILSQARKGRCNDYPKGVRSSERKRHPSRTDDDIVSTSWRHGAVNNGNKLATYFEENCYVSDFGSVSIVPNRFSRSRDAYVLDPELAAVATLRPIQEIKLAKTGDAEKSMLLFEGGLEVRNEKGLGAAYDLSTS